jgi:hypothetical protein
MRLLHHAFIANARDNLELTNELVHVLAALNERAIRVLLLKEPVIAVMLYKNMALRVARDLDLLIVQEDRPQIREILTALGYRSECEADSPEATLLYRFGCFEHERLGFHLKYTGRSRSITHVSI